MCKYHNRLFVFTMLLNIALLPPSAKGRPPDKVKSFFGFNDYADDFDLHFDQRQNGTENIRLSLDGVMIAVPAEAITDSDDRLFDELDLAQLIAERKYGHQQYNPHHSYKSMPSRDGVSDGLQDIPDGHKNEQRVHAIQIISPSGSDAAQADSKLNISADNEKQPEKQPTATAIEFNYLKPAPLAIGKNAHTDKRNKSKYRFLNLLRLFRRDPNHE